jgi:hypothetical protein
MCLLERLSILVNLIFRQNIIEYYRLLGVCFGHIPFFSFSDSPYIWRDFVVTFFCICQSPDCICSSDKGQTQCQRLPHEYHSIDLNLFKWTWTYLNKSYGRCKRLWILSGGATLDSGAELLGRGRIMGSGVRSPLDRGGTWTPAWSWSEGAALDSARQGRQPARRRRRWQFRGSLKAGRRKEEEAAATTTRSRDGGRRI